MTSNIPNEHTTVQRTPFPISALLYFVTGVAGLSAPLVLNSGLAPNWLEWLLKGSGGQGQGWQLMGALALCLAAVKSSQWAGQRYNLPKIERLGSLFTAALLLGSFCLVGAFVWAGLSDTTDSSFLASAISLAIGLATAAVVAAAHRKKAVTEEMTTAGFLTDWAWSTAMVCGGLFASLLASFAIVALMFSLAEHQLLPAMFGNALLEARRDIGPMRVLGIVWLVLQLGWIIPTGLQICRHGIGQGVEAFRFAVTSGLITMVLSFVATLSLLLIGPPAR